MTREVTIGTTRVQVLNHRAHQHEPWEICFVSALFPMLKPGMIVFDIGAEEGELTVAVAKVVGGENVHILEPSALYWPNIHAIWKANDLPRPGGCWQGFVSDKTRYVGSDFLEDLQPPWPKAIFGEIQMEGAFCFVDERPDISAITIDEYCRITCTHPDIILMDIEGAEVLALRGARETLEKGTTLFVSVHNEVALAKYGTKLEELFELTQGYDCTDLGYDHERHLRFVPK